MITSDDGSGMTASEATYPITASASQPALDFGDEPFDDPSNPTYSVCELADAINAQLRRGFDDGVWVRGEIDGLAQQRPAHVLRARRRRRERPGGDQRLVVRADEAQPHADVASAAVSSSPTA